MSRRSRVSDRSLEMSGDMNQRTDLLVTIVYRCLIKSRSSEQGGNLNIFLCFIPRSLFVTYHLSKLKLDPKLGVTGIRVW